jgi:hypothetical protein
MKRAALVSLYFLACLNLHAQAEEFIGRRPGLWQVTVSFIMPNAPAVAKMCLDADIAKSLLKDASCERNNIDRTGNRIAIDSVCHLNGTRVTTKAIVTLIDDTRYHVDITERADPAFNGRSDAVIAQDAKWLGPCPSDMKPGDVVDESDSSK